MPNAPSWPRTTRYTRLPRRRSLSPATPKTSCASQSFSLTSGSSRYVAPRGGGTGTNGQSLTDGLVVDLSRHMNRILAIDPERRAARVEAGVVKDQLNAALAPHGLFFAPELSTSNRATVGGMISTDACGRDPAYTAKRATMSWN